MWLTEQPYTLEGQGAQTRVAGANSMLTMKSMQQIALNTSLGLSGANEYHPFPWQSAHYASPSLEGMHAREPWTLYTELTSHAWLLQVRRSLRMQCCCGLPPRTAGVSARGFNNPTLYFAGQSTGVTIDPPFASACLAQLTLEHH